VQKLHTKRKRNAKPTSSAYMAAIGRFKGYDVWPDERIGIAGFCTLSEAPYGYKNAKSLFDNSIIR